MDITSASRRRFLAGLALPAAAAAAPRPGAPAPLQAPAGASELRYRTLGRTGLKLTSVGFGCMITSDPTVVEQAADLGINYFDTARGYQNGNNERMVGTALKKYRKNLHLSSKTSAKTGPEAVEHLETSLRELGTDYLDIWYLHGRSRIEQITDDLLEVQAKAKKEGKIRFSGVSTHTNMETLIPALAKQGAIDVVLTSYNFTMGPGIAQAIDQANAAGMGVVAMKVMAGGFRRVQPGNPLYDKLKTEGTMLAALKWVLRNPKIHTTIPSITDVDQLEEDRKAMIETLSPGDEKLLARQLDHIRPLYCRMCGACEGVCAKGLPVADLVRYVSYAEGYGQFALGRESFLSLDPERQAVRCADCTSCTVHCPNGVRVAERVSRAQEYFA